MLSPGLANDYSDDEFDADYRESSEEDDDELPKSMHRDRAAWIEDNMDDLAWLYRTLLENGREQFGQSFLQTGSINTFANFVYRNTTPLSDH